MYIDTHVHLNSDTLFSNLEHYIEKARKAHIQQMIVIGYDHESNRRALDIASRYDNIYAAVGYHPTEAKSLTDSDLDVLDQLLKHEKVVAIGECGLDFYWDKEHEDKQITLFEKHIVRSKTLNIPLVIHMRDATNKTYETLKKHAPVRGVMHCYSGSVEMAQRFIDLGLHISLGGPVTFLNAKTPKPVAESVSLERLLIETDAPYLAPHPYRGKQNDSSYLPLIAKAIAELKHINVETVARQTTDNAIKLFKLKEE